jgi:tetratricopeptide (TPR) repeat protein
MLKANQVWLLEAQAYERIQQDEEAITAVQEALKINNKNAYSWDLLLYLYQKNKGSKVDLTKLVVGILVRFFTPIMKPNSFIE